MTRPTRTLLLLGVISLGGVVALAMIADRYGDVIRARAERDREVPTVEELRTGQDNQELPFEVVQSAWADWFNEQVDAADVSVASRIGVWFTDPPSILPPD